MEFLESCKSIVKRTCAIGLATLGLSNVAYAQEKMFIHEDFADFQEVMYTYKASGPTLIFSDSPEFVYENGILYRDEVEGKVRIFFHHLNAVPNTTKKLALVLKNKDSIRPITYSITRQGMSGKTNDWLLDGKVAEEKYFGENQHIRQGKIGYGRSLEIISGKGTQLRLNDLWTGIVDLELDRKTEISVLMCDQRTDVELFNEQAKILPMDEHPLRGTFKNADWTYNITTKIDGTKAYMIKLASADEGEGYITGVDKTTSLPAMDYGNYGVLYEMNFNVVGDKPVRFVLNPIGGPFNGYGVLESGGKKKIIGMPEHDIATENKVEDARVLAKLKPGKYKFTWSPAGTASLPLRFFWFPEDKPLKVEQPKKYFKSYKKEI